MYVEAEMKYIYTLKNWMNVSIKLLLEKTNRSELPNTIR